MHSCRREGRIILSFLSFALINATTLINFLMCTKEVRTSERDLLLLFFIITLL